MTLIFLKNPANCLADVDHFLIWIFQILTSWLYQVERSLEASVLCGWRQGDSLYFPCITSGGMPCALIPSSSKRLISSLTWYVSDLSIVKVPFSSLYWTHHLWVTREDCVTILFPHKHLHNGLHIHWWSLPGLLIEVVVEQRFLNSIIHFTFVSWLSSVQKSPSHPLYLKYPRALTHSILFMVIIHFHFFGLFC